MHAGRGNGAGTAAQLAKAVRELEPYRPHYLGLDVDAVVKHIGRCRSAVGRGETPAPEPLRADPALVRGDEPELGAA